jgi:hypothetical protein
VTRDAVDLRSTLEAADAVGSLCSTVLYEALLFDKPVWQFYADGWPELAPNWRRSLAKRVASPRDLIDACRALVEDPRAGALEYGVVDRVFANRGTASVEIARHVGEMVTGRGVAARSVERAG